MENGFFIGMFSCCYAAEPQGRAVQSTYDVGEVRLLVCLGIKSMAQCFISPQADHHARKGGMTYYI